MNSASTAGLGELLRYVGELVDAGAAQRYRALGLSYRPRYTPVLRALAGGKATVTEIVAHSRLTQGAISQTVKLMVADGLVARAGLEDGRKTALQLTERGGAMLGLMQVHWQTTFAAIAALEAETGHPLRQVLLDTADALARTDFATRLQQAALEREGQG